jgi:hypothetical protein
MISLAANQFVLGSILIRGQMLRTLRLTQRGAVRTACLFGTPLWYYGVFSPLAYTHAGDTLLMTAVGVPDN